MSTILGLFEEAPASPSPSIRYRSPLRMLISLVVLIFLAEMIAMTVLYFLRPTIYVVETLLDGLIMVALIMPVLFALQLNPLLKEINERTRAEQALRTSEELLRKVLELLPVGVWITDPDGNIIHGNPASRKIWGGARYVDRDHYGEYKAWWADSRKPVKAEEWAAARAIRQRVTILNEEVEIESFDGTRKIMLNSAVPILDEQDEVQGAIIVNQEITARRQAEKALIQTNELLDRFFMSIDILIAYMDREFNFIRVNDTYAKSGGHPTDFYPGKNHFDLFPNPENQAIFKRVVETGEPFSALEKPFEYAEHPEWGVTYWDWSLQPVRGVDGGVEGLVMSLVDVTERKRGELQLERQNLELRQLSEAEHKQRELAESLVKAESKARRAAETLSAAAQALTQTLDLDQVANTLLDHLQEIIQPDVSGVTLLKDETGLSIIAARGLPGEAEEGELPYLPLDEVIDSLLERMKREQKSVFIPNILDYPIGEERGSLNHIKKWLVTPIIASGKIIGFVGLGKAAASVFNQEEMEWAEALVGQAAVTIQNAWLFEQVRSSSDRLQSLARKLVEVQENERYHIARELHDQAGQALSSLKISLGRLEQDPECPPALRRGLAESKDLADCVLEDLHRLAMDLRPAALDHLGLVAALEQFTKGLNSENLSVQFKAVGFVEERLPQDLETSLYRIVQEALTNVVRHAQASNVGILLRRDAGRVVVFVEDNGVGFSPGLMEKGERLGLVGMRERAEMLGGTLTIESSSDKGTAVIVEVPDVYSYSPRG